jgi:hypothetical protein
LIKKNKIGRPRSESPMVHTAVVLPQDLLKRLRTDAEQSNRGLSTEIRQRLQSTYDEEGPPTDPETRKLVASIESLAESLAGDLRKKWHESRYALAALKAGVATFLAPYQSDGDLNVRDADDPNDPPEVVGRTHARLIMAGRHREKE